MNSNVTPQVIAIIGAGLSGLVCARILQVNGVTATVYEADADAATRQQGGDLDIHTDTGQVALRDAGIYEEFLRHTIAGAESIRVMDKTARVFVDHAEGDGGNGRPEIKRTVLRQLLIDSLEPGTIRWSSKLLAARRTGARHELEFVDGTLVNADLVIGADGAWSKVRSLLTPVKPEYVGITVVEFRLAEARTRHPEALELVGNGSLFALSDNRYIGGHGGNDMALGCGLRVPEDWATTRGIDWANAAAAREVLIREFDGWAAPLTALIRDCDDTIWPRPIYALPTGTVWDSTHGVTLIGDAAHLMSPFAGEGANLALIDGADLARELLATSDPDAAIASYEKRMLPRGAKSAAASSKSLDMMFSATAPTKIVRMFRTMFILLTVMRPFERLFGGRKG